MTSASELSKFLVDTNFFYMPKPLRQALTEQVRLAQIQVYVPTLVYAERVRQLADKLANKYDPSFSLSIAKQIIATSRFTLLDFNQVDAEQTAQLWLDLKAKGYSKDDWRKHRLDILLCAIAQARNYTLITNDKGLHFDMVRQRMDEEKLREWLS